MQVLVLHLAYHFGLNELCSVGIDGDVLVYAIRLGTDPCQLVIHHSGRHALNSRQVRHIPYLGGRSGVTQKKTNRIGGIAVHQRTNTHITAGHDEFRRRCDLNVIEPS